MVSIGWINYTIDPAGIYHDSSESNDILSIYADRVVSSKYGLLKPANSWKEREMKSALVGKCNDIDCVVIGSSRVMQISSYRNNRSLTNLCGSLMNLGVSGGTLEDYLALSYELIQNKQRPKTVVFGVDPWSLDLKRDARWRAYKHSYEKMIEYLNKSYIRVLVDNVYVKWKLLINLINFGIFFTVDRKNKPAKNVNS